MANQNERQIQIVILLVGIVVIFIVSVLNRSPVDEYVDNTTKYDTSTGVVEKQTTEDKKEEVSTGALIFNISPEFVSFGRLKSTVTSNLKNFEMSMYIYAISDISPTNTENNGINYKKWYQTIDNYENKDSDLKTPDTGNNEVNTITTDVNGNSESDLLLFVDLVKSKNYSEKDIENLQASKIYSDNMLAGQAMSKNVFIKDKAVIIEYRFSKGDLNKIRIDYDTIKLPEICSKTSYTDELVGTYKEIVCRKEVKYNGE